jgi:putative PIN family toxin of toxin-antitoxin system
MKRKPRVVLDSVVTVSAFLTTGLAAELVSLCREKALLYTAEEILQEIHRVLLEKEHIRKRYNYSTADADIFVTQLREISTIVSQLPKLFVVERDPADNMIIACAVASSADYIISRDKDLLDLGEYQHIQIISPENFMQILRKE